MAARVKIAVDGMGGDFGPRFTFEACCIFLAQEPDVEIDFFVTEPDALPGIHLDRLRVLASPQAVLAEDSPAFVLRHKQSSSMGMALAAVREGAVQGCLSAGNTGGLVMLAAHILGITPGVTRPVLCTAVPTQKGACWLLDLGGILAPDADRLVEYAHLGASQAARVLKRKVSVALLNLGEEAEKGLPSVRDAAAQLAFSNDFEYVGFVEPAGLFAGAADVVVCDGLVGNMVLKSAEAAAATVLTILWIHFSASVWRRILAWFCRGIFRQIRRQLHPAGLNGALLLGVNGTVVKSHGGANQEAIVAALNTVLRAIRLS